MGLFDNLVDIVSAPVKIVANVAEVVTTPVADVANDMVEGVKDVFEI